MHGSRGRDHSVPARANLEWRRLYSQCYMPARYFLERRVLHGERVRVRIVRLARCPAGQRTARYKRRDGTRLYAKPNGTAMPRAYPTARRGAVALPDVA